ncbi:twin-arginine translocation signal domain-containing protein [candidate division KSB1 bacterium]|nr:twin-arginine translocation signal domain-containing protein [candidate division KSB1 bacterium]
MKRRNFIKTSVVVALSTGLGSTTARGFVPAHV